MTLDANKYVLVV